MRFFLTGLLLFIAGLAASALEKKTLADIDFNRCYSLKKTVKGSFSGYLPHGMFEDFINWSAGRCRSNRILDEFGEAYLNFDIDGGVVQFHIPLPGLQAGKLYKVTMVVRSRLSDQFTPVLRLRQKPWTTLKYLKKIPVSDQFITLTAPFVLNKIDPNNLPALFLPVLDANGERLSGSIGFKSIRVEEISKQEFENLQVSGISQTILRKPADARNFLRNSSFPKGLQSGWSRIGGDGYSMSVVKTVENDIGPSGENVLLLDSAADKTAGISSEPFVASGPRKGVTVSFAYRGRGNFSAQVLSAEKTLADVKLTPDEKQWKRAVIDVPLSPWLLAAVLNISGQGQLYVDAFRAAEQGRGEFQPSGEHEISFFLPESETSESRIQFADEEPVLNYYVTGDAGDIVIRSSVTDLYGGVVKLPEMKGKTGAIRYSANAARYGQFRIEAQAFRSGKAVSVVNEMVVTRLPRPVYWGADAPDSPFGIHAPLLESGLQALKAGGFNWIRLHDGMFFLSSWYHLEPEKGKWRFRDREIRLIRRNFLKIYGQLGGTPRWASNLKNLNYSHGYYNPLFTPLPEYEGDWANYCEVMAKRYKGIIDDWFIWNEPWSTQFFHRTYDNGFVGFGTLEKTAEVYARYSKLAYLAAKKSNPDSRISGFNAGSADWSGFIYRNGGFRYCDELDYHTYYKYPCGFPGDGIEKLLKEKFRGVIRKEGFSAKPYIMSEGKAGTPSTELQEPDTGLYKHTVTWAGQKNTRKIAEDQVRFMLSHLASGVKRVFFYTAHTCRGLHRGSDLQIMLGSDGYPVPGLVAMAAFAHHVEGKKFTGCHRLAEGVFAALFSDQRKTAAVITGGASARAELKCSVPHVCADLYGNPVLPYFKGELFYITAECPPEKLAEALRIQ